MKHPFTLALIISLCSLAVAQPCGNSGSSICSTTLQPILSPEGFHPSDGNQIPCLTRGTAYAQVIQLVFPTSVQPQGLSGTYGVNSWKIDSINNLPCGVCWASNVSNSVFFPQGDVACIKFSGTTNDVPGLYKLRIKFKIGLSNGLTVSNQDGDYFGWTVYLRVAEPGSFCPLVDTSSVSRISSSTGSINVPVVSPAGPLTLCQGGNAVLTADAGYAAYLWSTGATTQSITVTQSGNYSVKVYGNCADQTSNTVTVTVKSGNVLSIIPFGSTTFCTGGSVILAATPGFANYTWSNSVNDTAISVSQSGSYTVSGLDTANGCTTTSAATIVKVLPPNFNVAVSATPTATCAGDTVLLDAGAGYSTYSWSTGANTQTVRVTNPGNYTVSVIYPVGTCAGAGLYTLNSLPVPEGDVIIDEAFNDSVKCEGKTISLLYDGNDIATVSYQWYRNSFIISGANAPGYDATQAGNYYCRLSKSGGCTIQSSSFNLNFLPAPGVAFTPNFSDPLCTNAGVITLSGGQPSGGNYSIDIAGINITTIDPSHFTGTHDIIYSYTGSNGCVSYDTAVLHITNCTGLDGAFNATRLRILPNPFTKQIILYHPKLASFNIALTDYTGKVCASGACQESSFTIATNNLAAGNYFLNMTEKATGKLVYTTKLIKQ
jgi:hypothetical protein